MRTDSTICGWGSDAVIRPMGLWYEKGSDCAGPKPGMPDVHELRTMSD